MNYENEKYENELGYKIPTIMGLFSEFKSKRTKFENMWKLLNAIDTGKFWDIYGKFTPSFAIKPDTNFINQTKTNYTNSLYVGKYIPNVFPRFREDASVSNSINEFLEYQMDKIKFSKLQKIAGESASLYNLGAIELGWNTDIINGPEGKFIGKIEARNIDVLSLYLDPTVTEYLKGRAIFIEEYTPIIEILNEPKLSERMNIYLDKLKNDGRPIAQGDNSDVAMYYGEESKTPQDNCVRLLTCYFKYFEPGANRYRVDKIWIIGNGYVLNVIKGLKPCSFPIRVLYSNDPVRNPYGVPTTRLILYSSMAVNFMDSADSTIIGNAFRRGKVISRSSGINEIQFAKYGDDPNKLWVVEGDPNNLLRYVDPPTLPADRYIHRANLIEGINLVTGVDSSYTGRDTNSIQTTGGMDIYNQRLTMSDNTRVLNLQEFIISVAELLLEFYTSNAKEVNFPKRKKDGSFDEIISINFENIRSSDMEFDFNLNVSASTPINIHKLAEKADILMEKQMQYNPQPAYITMEEWLQYQDIPQKYHILRRIQDERNRDDVEDIQSEIINYAGMVNEGMQPQSAINQLAQERQLKREQPGLGNTGGGSIQSRQMG